MEFASAKDGVPPDAAATTCEGAPISCIAVPAASPAAAAHSSAEPPVALAAAEAAAATSAVDAPDASLLRAAAPSHKSMLVETIAALADRTGSSASAIETWIIANFRKVAFKRFKRGLETGDILAHNNHKNSYKLPVKKAPAKTKM